MGNDVPFRDVVAYAIGGGWGSEYPTDDAVPVSIIRGTDFAGLRAGTAHDVPRRYEGRAKAEKRTLCPGDVVLEISGGSPTSGQSTGRTLLVKESTLADLGGTVIPASFCRLIRFETAKVDPRYAYYSLQNMYASGRAAGYEHRSTGLSNFQFEYFLDHELIRLVPLREQRAIAHILGTLDDKIDLNRRMNDTLEVMARALFKSWFVDFQPVRAKAEGRDSGLPQPIADLFPDHFLGSEPGLVPAGWRTGKLGDVAEHQRRGVRPSEIDGGTPYIALEHMPRRSIALGTWATSDGIESGKFRFSRGEILFGKLRPYFHKVGVAPVDGVCSTDIVVLSPRADEWFGLVLGAVSSESFVEFTSAGSTGTKMPRTSWAEMARYPLTIPPEVVGRAFNTGVRPLIDRIAASIHENRSLAAIRDALLPRLITGELPVSQAERLLEAVPE